MRHAIHPFNVRSWQTPGQLPGSATQAAKLWKDTR